jgi:hypothetical protein
MDPRLLPGFQRNFPKHNIAVMLRADIQRKTLQEMLLAAQRAEEDYLNVQCTTRGAVGLGGQSFFSCSDTRGVSAFPSQAETTLTSYSKSGGKRGGGKGEKRPISCFGCGGLHPWSEYVEGKHVVKCPNSKNPGVADKAEKNLEKYRATRKKQREKNSKKRNLATTNFLDFDDVSQQRIWEQVLQTGAKSEVGDTTSVISAITSTSQQPKKRDPQRKRNTGFILIAEAQVLAARVTPSRQLCQSASRATYRILSYS